MKLTFVTLILAASAFAQGQPAGSVHVFVDGGEKIMMERSAGGMAGGPVKGSPYSATIVTESIQTLADGNRISQKNTSFVARDSMGRMRTELTIPKLNGLNVAEKSPMMVTIQDSVGGEMISLNANSKTYTRRSLGPQRTMVTKLDSEMISTKLDAEKAEKLKERMEYAPGVVVGGYPATASALAAMKRRKSNANIKQESLGMKVIEGVSADGTRTTETIPAGEVGNEKPIEIVSETWVSNELHAVVYSKRSDPRMGDQIMTLTNISRNEPAASLFNVPADYKEGKDGPVMFQYRTNE